MCISHLTGHVQVIRRGYGLWIEVIDVGVLSDCAFIGTIQMMPIDYEWLPNMDGMVDLVRNPTGQEAGRPWHQSFEGVPVIDVCLRRTGSWPLMMPHPSAPPFPGIELSYPPFNPHCARHGLEEVSGSEVDASTVVAVARSQVVAPQVVAVAGRPPPPPPPPPQVGAVPGRPPPPSCPAPTLEKNAKNSVQIQTKAPPQTPKPKAPPGNYLLLREDEVVAAFLKLKIFHVDSEILSRKEWKATTYLHTLSLGTPVPGGNGISMNAFAIGMVRHAEIDKPMEYDPTTLYEPHHWVTTDMVQRSQVLYGSLIKLAEEFDAAMARHGQIMYGALYGFHSVSSWLLCIIKQQVVMGVMAAALAKQGILPSRTDSEWGWGKHRVNMIVHIKECLDFIEDMIIGCGGHVQLNVQRLQAPPQDTIDRAIAARNDLLLSTAFPRRNLHLVPVMVPARARPGTLIMVTSPEVRGHKVLALNKSYILTARSLGLDMESESWWIVSTGHWYPRRQLLNVHVSGLLVCQGSRRQSSFMCDIIERRALRVPDVASCITRLVGTYAS